MTSVRGAQKGEALRSIKEHSDLLPLKAAPHRATADSAVVSHAAVVTSRSASLRGIQRVPTHAVGRAHERRAYVRARLSLPIRVTRIAGQRGSRPQSLHTRNISSSGLLFDYPQMIEPGTPIEFEVLLVDRPMGRGSVRMCTLAHVVRAQEIDKPGWHGLAAVFDDIRYIRDDAVSSDLATPPTFAART